MPTSSLTTPLSLASIIFATALTLAAWPESQAEARAHGLGSSRPTSWQDRYDRAGRDDVVADATVAGNRVYAVGMARQSSGNRDFAVRAYDSATGALAWADLFDYAGKFDLAQAVTVRANQVYVAGFARNPGGDFDWVVRSYDARTGAPGWTSVFRAADFGDNNPIEHCIAADETAVYSCGVATDAHGIPSFTVLAMDAKTGALRWKDLQNRGGFSLASKAIVNGTSLLVSGNIGDDSGGGSLVIRSYQASTGKLRWENGLNPGPGLYVDGHILSVDQDRAFVGGGSMDPSTGNILWTVRAVSASTGKLLWQDLRSEGGVLSGVITSEAKAGVVVMGGSGGANCLPDVSSNCDLIARAYDERTGRMLWEQRRDGYGADDEVFSLAILDERVILGSVLVNPAAHGTDGLLTSYGLRTGTTGGTSLVPTAFPNAIACGQDRCFAAGTLQDPGAPSDFWVESLDFLTRH